MYSVRVKKNSKAKFETVKQDKWKLSEAVLWAQGYQEALKVTPKYYQLQIAIFFNDRKVLEL